MPLDLGLGTISIAFVGALIGLIPLYGIGFNTYNWWDGRLTSKGHPIPAVLLFVGCIIVGGIIGSTLPAPVSYSTITPIYSASTFVGTNGAFVLGTGTVESDPSFIYYIGDNQSGYTIQFVSASKSRVFLDTDINPYLRSNCIHNSMYSIDRCTYELHVPSNSIRQQFDLSLM